MIQKALKTRLARQMGTVLTGNLVSKLCAFFGIMILTRSLGPGEYGIYAIGLSIVSIAAEFSDIGLNASAVRFGAEYFSAGRLDKLQALYSILLRSRVVIGLTIAIAGYFASPVLASRVFEKPELEPYLKIAFFGPFGILFNTVLISFFESQQKFRTRALVEVISGASQLVMILALAFSHHLTPLTGMLAYIAGPWVSVLVGFTILEGRHLSIRKWDPEVASAVVHYGKWMAVWGFTLVLQNRLDILMLTRMTTMEEVGFFHAASRVAMLANLIPYALASVGSPRMMAAQVQGHLKIELNKILKVTVLVAFLIVIGSFVGPTLAPLVLGREFGASGRPMMVLAWGWALLALNLPFGLALNVLNRPKITAVAGLFTLVQTFLLNLVLIPRFGATGAAATFAFSLFTTLVICSTAYVLLTRKVAQPC